MYLHAILILLLLSGSLNAQEGAEPLQSDVRGDLRLMWYNVENLFHPSKAADSLVDDEFIPEGVRVWTYRRYRDKLTRLARVIVAAGQWEPPDIVGLCEVEEAQVLEDLVAHPILLPYNYSYLHHEGPDHRGMDVACLFRGERFNPVNREFISPVEGEGMDQTREMVYLKGVWGRKDTLELFLVHFISRYRGSGITAQYRRKQIVKLAALMDSVVCHAPGNLVIAAGDFNDSPGAWSMEPLAHMVLPTLGDSYKYHGVWSGIDLSLLGGGGEKYRIHASVFRHSALLIPDMTYGGEKPFRTYEGYRYAGGYSDHLPVLVDISHLPFSWDLGR